MLEELGRFNNRMNSKAVDFRHDKQQYTVPVSLDVLKQESAMEWKNNRKSFDKRNAVNAMEDIYPSDEGEDQGQCGDNNAVSSTSTHSIFKLLKRPEIAPARDRL